MTSLNVSDRPRLVDYSPLWVEMWRIAHSPNGCLMPKEFIEKVSSAPNGQSLPYGPFKAFKTSTLKTKFSHVKKLHPKDLNISCKLHSLINNYYNNNDVLICSVGEIGLQEV